MSVVHIVVGTLIVFWAVSPAAAVVLGRVIRGRDRQVPQSPPVRAGGEDLAHRRAHLRPVR